jgi:hypothetical protein
MGSDKRSLLDRNRNLSCHSPSVVFAFATLFATPPFLFLFLLRVGVFDGPVSAHPPRVTPARPSRSPPVAPSKTVLPPMLPALPWVLLVALGAVRTHPAHLLYALVWSPPVASSVTIVPPMLPPLPTPAWTQVANCRCCLSRSRHSPVLAARARPCWVSLLPSELSTPLCITSSG